jgi:hypothetical protein
VVDTNFDYRTDSNGKDPDSASPTLKLHHQLLWSKPLPSGEQFSLLPKHGGYLFHSSNLGEFSVSSDTITNSFRSTKRLATLISQISASDLDGFQRIGSTTGARLIFPSNRVEGKPTINVARGFAGKIGDRFDLTLECIRLHYIGQANPLGDTLLRYQDFFKLFESFEGYVDFFLLNDLVSKSKIDFFLSFDGEFNPNPRPRSIQEYMEYMRNSMEFVANRNLRIDSWFKSR